MPNAFRPCVGDQVGRGGYGPPIEFFCGLTRRDKDRRQIRSALLGGASSTRGPVENGSYFESLRGHLKPIA